MHRQPSDIEGSVKRINQRNSTQNILDDLSITTQQNQESQEDIYSQQLFGCDLLRNEQFERLYPDVFEQYSHQLVAKLSNFIKSFRRHKVAKLLHYELNCAFTLLQISHKLTKIKSYYQNDQLLINSFKLLQFYLKLHSLTNLCKLVDMVKILINKKQISYQWISEKKTSFIQLKTNHKVKIQQRAGMQLLIVIDKLTFTIVQNCSFLKYKSKQFPTNLNKVNIDFFDNLPKPLQTRIKLIPQNSDIDLPKIQKHFQDQKLQYEFHICTKSYFNKLYKQIHQFYQNNPKDRNLNELIYFTLLAKISGENLPFKLFDFMQKQKQKIGTTSKIIKQENLQEFILRLNVYFRAQLPKLHFLVKSRGLMKLLSFLHESESKDIQKEIFWCSNYKTNLNNL